MLKDYDVMVMLILLFIVYKLLISNNILCGKCYYIKIYVQILNVN